MPNPGNPPPGIPSIEVTGAYTKGPSLTPTGSNSGVPSTDIHQSGVQSQQPSSTVSIHSPAQSSPGNSKDLSTGSSQSIFLTDSVSPISTLVSKSGLSTVITPGTGTPSSVENPIIPSPTSTNSVILVSFWGSSTPKISPSSTIQTSLGSTSIPSLVTPALSSAQSIALGTSGLLIEGSSSFRTQSAQPLFETFTITSTGVDEQGSYFSSLFTISFTAASSDGNEFTGFISLVETSSSTNSNGVVFPIVKTQSTLVTTTGDPSFTRPASISATLTRAENSTPSLAATSGTVSTSIPSASDWASGNCTEWHTVQTGETCGDFGVPLSVVLSLNPDSNITCNALVAGDTYCLAWSLRAKPSLTNPAPTGSSITGFCDQWHQFEQGQTCADSLNSLGITIEDFLLWNSEIKPNCNALDPNILYCAGWAYMRPSSTSMSYTSSTSTNSLWWIPDTIALGGIIDANLITGIRGVLNRPEDDTVSSLRGVIAKVRVTALNLLSKLGGNPKVLSCPPKKVKRLWNPIALVADLIKDISCVIGDLDGLTRNLDEIEGSESDDDIEAELEDMESKIDSLEDMADDLNELAGEDPEDPEDDQTSTTASTS